MSSLSDATCEACDISDDEEVVNCYVCERSFHRKCFEFVEDGGTDSQLLCKGCEDASTCWNCGTTDNQKTWVSCSTCTRRFHLECETITKCAFCDRYREVVFYPKDYIGTAKRCFLCAASDKNPFIQCILCKVCVHLNCHGYITFTCPTCRDRQAKSMKDPKPTETVAAKWRLGGHAVSMTRIPTTLVTVYETVFCLQGPETSSSSSSSD